MTLQRAAFVVLRTASLTDTHAMLMCCVCTAHTTHSLPAGALVAGPALDGTYLDDRTVSSQSAVGLHHNVPLIGLLGGLIASGVTTGQCAAGHGLFQLYTINSLP